MKQDKTKTKEPLTIFLEKTEKFKEAIRELFESTNAINVETDILTEQIALTWSARNTIRNYRWNLLFVPKNGERKVFVSLKSYLNKLKRQKQIEDWEFIGNTFPESTKREKGDIRIWYWKGALSKNNNPVVWRNEVIKGDLVYFGYHKTNELQIDMYDCYCDFFYGINGLWK